MSDCIGIDENIASFDDSFKTHLHEEGATPFALLLCEFITEFFHSRLSMAVQVQLQILQVGQPSSIEHVHNLIDIPQLHAQTPNECIEFLLALQSVQCVPLPSNLESLVETVLCFEVVDTAGWSWLRCNTLTAASLHGWVYLCASHMFHLELSIGSRTLYISQWGTSLRRTTQR